MTTDLYTGKNEGDLDYQDYSLDPNDDIDPEGYSPFDFETDEEVELETWAKERPHFGKSQIRTLRSLKVGKRLRLCGPLGLGAIVTITKAPFERLVHPLIGFWVIEVQYDDPKKNYFPLIEVENGNLRIGDDATGRIHLSSFSVLPSHGSKTPLWRSNSWFEHLK